MDVSLFSALIWDAFLPFWGIIKPFGVRSSEYGKLRTPKNLVKFSKFAVLRTSYSKKLGRFYEARRTPNFVLQKTGQILLSLPYSEKRVKIKDNVSCLILKDIQTAIFRAKSVSVFGTIQLWEIWRWILLGIIRVSDFNERRYILLNFSDSEHLYSARRNKIVSFMKITIFKPNMTGNFGTFWRWKQKGVL